MDQLGSKVVKELEKKRMELLKSFVERPCPNMEQYMLRLGKYEQMGVDIQLMLNVLRGNEEQGD